MRKSFLILATIISCFSLRIYPQIEISVDCQDSWGPDHFNKVTIRVNKGKTNGFARFFQDFPVGFDVIKDSLQDADFRWSNDQLNIVWIRLPEDPVITFSYYAKPEKSMIGIFNLTGKFIYVMGRDTRQTSEMKEKAIRIGGSNGVLSEELKKRSVEEKSARTTVAMPDYISKTVAQSGGIENVAVKELKKTAAFVSGQKSTVVYRVQVARPSTNYSEEELKRRIGIDSPERITIIRSGNMFRYQVGLFSDYRDANTLLRKLTAKGIKDAFVVAYRGGERITIEKALKPGPTPRQRDKTARPPDYKTPFTNLPHFVNSATTQYNPH